MLLRRAVRFVPDVSKKHRAFSSGLWVQSRTHKPEDEGLFAPETPGSEHPSIQRTNPQDLPQYGNKFATNKPSALCRFQWVMRQASRMTSDVSFVVALFLSFVTQETRRLAVLWAASLETGVGEFWILDAAVKQCRLLSLALSLSLSHTHTHTHKQTQTRFKRWGMARNTPQP